MGPRQALDQGRVSSTNGCKTTIAPAGTARSSSPTSATAQTAGFNNGTLHEQHRKCVCQLPAWDAELGNGQRRFRGDLRRTLSNLCLVDRR